MDSHQPDFLDLSTPQPSSRRVRVAELYPNPEDPSSLQPIQAYAKLAGHDWTYYIVDTSIVLGRAPESSESTSDLSNVHVDLGPAKTVSRKHATIEYNYRSGAWDLYILGRNGVKVDGFIHKPSNTDECVNLVSGSLLELGGVQFIFLLPETDTHTSNRATADSSSGNSIHTNKRYNKRTRKASPVARQPKRGPKRAKSSSARNSMGFNTGSGLDDSDFNDLIDIEGSSNPLDYLDVSSSMLDIDLDLLESPISLSSLKINGEYPDFVNRKHDIDYSDDANKSLKPRHSYASLIAEAICASPIRAVSLNEIYTYLTENYAYFRHAKNSWHNSIRHNLSLNQAFVKRTRANQAAVKGCLWTIDPDRAFEIKDDNRKPKKRAAELFGLDKPPGPPSAAEVAAAVADYGIPPPPPHPFFNPYASSYQPNFHATGQGFPGTSPFSMTNGPFHGSTPFMPFAPDMFSGNGRYMNGSTQQQQQITPADIPIHARKPIRSFYSLHHTTPDLTLLPTTSGLMRSMPKLFDHFRLMDMPPIEGDILFGSLVDKETFPELGLELALTKENLARSKAVHETTMIVHTLVLSGHGSGVTRIAGGSGVCSSPVIANLTKYQRGSLASRSSRAMQVSGDVVVDRAVELALERSKCVSVVEGSDPTDCDVNKYNEDGQEQDYIEESESGSTVQTATPIKLCTKKRLRAFTKHHEGTKGPVGNGVLVLHNDDITSHAVSHASSAAAVVLTACAVAHMPGAKVDVHLSGLVPHALHLIIAAQLVSLPVTQVITTLLANMLAESLIRMRHGGFLPSDPRRANIEKLVLDAESLVIPTGDESSGGQPDADGQGYQQETIDQLTPPGLGPGPALETGMTGAAKTDNQLATDSIVPNRPFMYGMPTTGILSPQPLPPLPPPKSLMTNTPMMSPYMMPAMSPFGYPSMIPPMQQRYPTTPQYSLFGTPLNFSSFGLAGYYARMMASHQLVMQGRVAPHGALVGPPSSRGVQQNAVANNPENGVYLK